jgi:hypothetical protein
VLFSRVDVHPDSAVYLQRDDRLRISAWNAVSGLVVHVRARYQLPSGMIVPQLLVVTPTADRALSSGAFDLGEGYLLSVTATASGASPARGQSFVQVTLDRGGAPGAGAAAVLIAGYLEAAMALGWPGGQQIDASDGAGALRSVTGTNPAAGAEVSETVPTGARWRLRGLRAQLVTDATVATRRVHLVVDDGTNTLIDQALADTQTASLTRNYNLAPYQYAPAAAAAEIYGPLPGDLVLRPGWRVRTATDNLAVGDNWGAPQLYVEEWQEP